ncbi:MAG: ArsR/SmtB family transcription factor [Nocardioides sp.]
MDPFAALADPVRRALLHQLADAPARVVDLAATHPISRPAISRHLRLLGEAGLVEADIRGRERHYRLEPDGLAPLTAFVAELTGPAPRFSERDLDGLDLEVRRTVRQRTATVDAATDTQETA